MAENIWEKFETPNSSYHLQDLGRTAVFLIPLRKLHWTIDGVPCGEHVQRFLAATFGGYNHPPTLVPRSGGWVGPDEKVEFDESLRYEVAFVGKDRIPYLMEELSRIAVLIDEKCIFFMAGQYACTIHPR
jgi:hypothetical protein